MQHEPRIKRDGHADDVTPGMVSHQFQCRSAPECLGPMVQDVVEVIRDSGLYSAALCQNAQVVLAEALNNIVEHGYQGEASEMIQLTVHLEDGKVSVETLDFGVPMPGLAVPMAKLPDTKAPTEALPEGGFGWYLIHTLAPNPEYLRRGNTNILRFVVKDPDA